MDINDHHIHAVFAKHLDVDRIIGYVFGNVSHKDISAYFDDEKGHGIYMKSIHVTDIPEGYAESFDTKMKRITELEKELKELRKK